MAGGINLYAYANINPINKTDPYGLYSEWTFNGALAHTETFSHFRRLNPGKYDYDRTIGKLGIGVTRLRPDIIDMENGKVWELKPYSHFENSKYYQRDLLQISSYLCETGFSPGDSRQLVPYDGMPAGSIEDFWGFEREVLLYAGSNGFIYHKLGNRHNNKYLKELKNVAIGIGAIVGGAIFSQTPLLN